MGPEHLADCSRSREAGIVTRMLLAIISDTHENLPAISAIKPILNTVRPDIVVHCGDIISPPVLQQFAGLPMRVVFGNNDGEREGLQAMAASCGFPPIEDELRFEAGGKTFYVYHGTRTQILETAIVSGSYDYVLTGHTHRKRDERIGRSRVVNPGALFMAPIFSIAVLQTDTDKLEFIEVVPEL